MNRAIFLDRDGVLNQKVPTKDFVKTTDELVYLPNVAKITKLLGDMGYKLIIISNQSGINRGIIKSKNLEEINDKLKHDLHIDGIYYCPHLPEEDCECRKPKSALIKKAAKEFSIDIRNSWFVGDNDTDIIAGKTAGCNVIKVDGDIGLSQIQGNHILFSKDLGPMGSQEG